MSARSVPSIGRPFPSWYGQASLARQDETGPWNKVRACICKVLGWVRTTHSLLHSYREAELREDGQVMAATCMHLMVRAQLTQLYQDPSVAPYDWRAIMSELADRSVKHSVVPRPMLAALHEVICEALRIKEPFPLPGAQPVEKEEELPKRRINRA
jgi:hypothetical protein